MLLELIYSNYFVIEGTQSKHLSQSSLKSVAFIEWWSSVGKKAATITYLWACVTQMGNMNGLLLGKDCFGQNQVGTFWFVHLVKAEKGNAQGNKVKEKNMNREGFALIKKKTNKHTQKQNRLFNTTSYLCLSLGSSHLQHEAEAHNFS